MMWPWPDESWGFPGAQRPPRSVHPDVRLTYEVADALLADDRTRRQPVTVEVQNGVVLLSGTVPDRRTAEVVTALVRQVPRVRDISNTMRTRVKQALEADEGAPATSGHRESDAFDEIMATLSPREESTGRMPGQVRLFFVAVVVLLLGWLVMKLGTPGVLIAVGVSVVMLGMTLRRRRRNRK
jgi:hypothetical protein